MTHDELARDSRCHIADRCRLFATLSLFAIAFVATLGLARPALADGGLETQKGGLFHRKGFISPEIYRRKEPPKTTASQSQSNTRVASRTSTTPSTTRARKTTTNTQPSKRRIPQRVVRRREQKVARTPTPAKKPVRVASLTQEVPSSSSSGSSGPSKPTTPSVTGGAARVQWAASSRCVPARLRNAINHVARTYGRVRVNSTCRSRRHNRRVGGASRSYHMLGKAADIRVFGNIRGAARYLRSVAGGYKHYGGGLFHIDTGPKRSW